MINFRNGTELAVQQGFYINKYNNGGGLSGKEIADMEHNQWVALASRVAPSNLVIRQWALIDLFRGKALHKNKIFKMMDILTYKTNEDYKIWAEGYSYYCYTMDIINVWIKRFETTYDLANLKFLVHRIDLGFLLTSYTRNNVLYPAPFGDVYDLPLSPLLQLSRQGKTRKIACLTFNYINENVVWYRIRGYPIGFNAHVNMKDYVTVIKNGVPLEFKFYDGWDKKYKNSFEEYKDAFHPKRWASIPNI